MHCLRKPFPEGYFAEDRQRYEYNTGNIEPFKRRYKAKGLIQLDDIYRNLEIIQKVSFNWTIIIES